MVTSENLIERKLHSFVGFLCGEENTCKPKNKPKVDFKSQATAMRAATEFGAKVGRDFDVYNCWFCRGWHIGGARNLTIGKFFSILWVWILRKKRKSEKIRTYRNFEHKFGATSDLCVVCGADYLSREQRFGPCIKPEGN